MGEGLEGKERMGGREREHPCCVLREGVCQLVLFVCECMCVGVSIISRHRLILISHLQTLLVPILSEFLAKLSL